MFIVQESRKRQICIKNDGICITNDGSCIQNEHVHRTDGQPARQHPWDRAVRLYLEMKDPSVEIEDFPLKITL